jgi:hypothetical protein
MGETCGMCGDERNVYNVLVIKPERDHLEDLIVDVRIILKCILKRWHEKA